MRSMKRLTRRILAGVCLGVSACGMVSCSGVAIPPTYTQAELKAICERRGGWWHDDDLMGGFCEYQSAGLQAP